MGKYFFYSRKRQVLKKSEINSVQNYAIINGKEVPYNICSSTMDHGCLWDDMVFLGEGEWSRCTKFNLLNLGYEL